MRSRIFLIFAILVCFATSMMAQTNLGTISGRVEDTSAARIPGVAVTVTSTALQGQRDTISDEGGNYRFANLPIGTYTVKFELPGFKTMIRQDIFVQAGVTTSLNQAMEVATVAETVTVTGESPMVDLEQVKIGVNFGSAIKDNVVNARNYWALLAQAPGLKTSTPDVGGSTMGSQVGYRSYGISGQNQVYLDGVNLTEGNNGGSMYGDYGSWAEVNVSSAGNGADTRTAGSTVNAVVRSGTNKYHSTILGAYEGKNFQANNFTDEVKKTGLGTGDKFDKYWDMNMDFGGPLKKDKFWFYSSFRREYSGIATNMRKPGGKNYVLPASGIAPDLCTQLPCGNTVDGSDVGAIFYSRLTNGTTKLTYQLNSNNQLSVTGNMRLKYQPYRGGSGTSAKNVNPESAQQQQSWFHTFTVQWTSTLNNRTTLKVSLNNFGYHWVNLRNSTANRIVDRAATSTLTGGYSQGAYIRDLNANRRWHEDVEFSRFFNGAGTHNLKIGYEYLWEDYRGSTGGYPDHILYGFNLGKPERITVYNTPVQWQQNGMIDNSFYLQDKWDPTRKLTINLGLRFDRYDVFNPAQVRESAGGNPFNAAADIPGLASFGNKQWERQSIKAFNLPVPRFSMIYDLFGNGRTAIKASYGLFSYNPSYDLAGSALENGSKNAIFNWNGTLPINTPDALRACIANKGCSLNTGPALTRPAIDPNIKLGYTHEYTVGLDQQLFRDFNLRANYIRKIEAGNYGTLNREYTLADWAPFQFNDPGIDGVYGNSDDNPGGVLTAFNRTKTAAAADPFITYSQGAGNLYKTWEIEGIKRMSHHFQVLAGADWTKLDFGASVFSNNANTIIGQTLYPASHYWDWTGKTTLQYEAPRGVKVSTVFKSQKGATSTRTVNIFCDRLVTAASIAFAGSTSAACTAAGGKAPLQGSFDLTVEQAGSKPSDFLPALTTLDLSVTKTFTLTESGHKIEGMFDIFNISNSNATQGWGATSSTTSFSYVNSSNQTVAVTGYPTYHRPNSILPPRVFRLSARYSF